MVGAIFYLLILILAVTFSIRAVGAIHSADEAREFARQPVLHALWFLSLPVCMYLFASFVAMHPPDWWDRRDQRKKMRERVEQAGGWGALKRDALLLIRTNQDSGFRWSRFPTNEPALPPAIAALQPLSVSYDPPKDLALLRKDFTNASQVSVVRIKLFGMHSTGGHSTPYYGLELIFGPGAKNYRPRSGHSVGVSGNGHSSFSKNVEDVYEIY